MRRGRDRSALGRGPRRDRVRAGAAALAAAWVATLLGAWALLTPGSEAQAAKPRCRLERLDASRLDEDGRVKVLGGVVELEGQVDPSRPAASYRLQVNGKTVAKAEKLEAFEKSGQELYIVLAVEVAALYAPVIEQIKEAVREFLGALPPRTKVKLISFGYEIHPLPAFLAPPALVQSIDDLTPEDEGDVQLLNALSAGLTSLNKLPGPKDKKAEGPPPRRVLVVLSDGLNQLMDRKNFKRVGDLMKNNGVPLFPIAFSPRDDRGPLLNLGELAKRSHGTFRWAQKPENLKEQFLNLAEELRQSAVLTFPGKKLDAKDLAKATVTMQCGEIRSNAAAAPVLPHDEGTRWWKWVLGIVLGLVGLWGAAQGALWLLKRRAGLPSRPPGQPAPQPAALPQAAPTGGYPTAGVQSVGELPVRPGRVYTATLIGIGPLGGTRIKVEAVLFIGKAVQGPNTLQVSTDPSLAATHCELRRDPQGFVLVELGAPSGCFINDQRISGMARVQDGDLIRLGSSTQLKFRLDD